MQDPATLILKREFKARKLKNSSYSLRAFARDVGLHPGSLSSIISGKRSLPRRAIGKVCEALDLTKEERLLLERAPKKTMNAIEANKLKIKLAKILNEETYFNILSEWEYYSVLNLIKLKSFRNDINWISSKLDLPKARIKEILQELKSVDLIEDTKKKQIKRKFVKLATTRDIKSEAIRLGHKRELANAITKLDHVSVALRDFQSLTLCFDTSKMLKAKNLIQEFKTKFDELMENTSGDDVYTLSIQFYPVTMPRNKDLN